MSESLEVSETAIATESRTLVGQFDRLVEIESQEFEAFMVYAKAIRGDADESRVARAAYVRSVTARMTAQGELRQVLAALDRVANRSHVS